jgi:hypothetical protein
MDIVIVGKFTVDIGRESILLLKEFQTEIRRMSADVNFRSPISGILLFPTIINPEIIGSMSDYVKFRKSENGVRVATTIPHQKWISASTTERIRLLADNIRESLNRIKEVHLLADDRVALLAAVDKAAQILTRKRLN